MWKGEEEEVDPFEESLQKISIIAKETFYGFPNSDTKEVKRTPSEVQNVFDLKEVFDLELQIVDLKRRIDEQELLIEAGSLRDGSLFERRNDALESLLLHLEQIVNVSDRLVRQLRHLSSNSDSSFKFYVHRSHHKGVCDVFQMMSSFVADLETNFRTLSEMENVDSDLDKFVTLPDAKLSRLCNLFVLIERLRDVFRAKSERREQL